MYFILGNFRHDAKNTFTDFREIQKGSTTQISKA